jgi:cell division protein FtsQ
LAKKRIRKNYYKNSRAKNKARFFRRFFLLVKTVFLLGVLGGTSFLFILFHDALVQSAYFKAEKIEVEGHRRLSKEGLLQQAGVALGDNILGVNLKILRNNLLADPWVAAAEVKRILPDTIHIRVREHVPIAIIAWDRPLLLNDSGQVFKALDSKEIVRVPVIEGLEPSDIDPNGKGRSHSLKAVMDALHIMRSCDGLIPTHTINCIHVDRETGLTLRGRDDMTAIRLGFGDYASKLNRLKEMVAYFSGGDQLLHMGVMDLNDMDRVVVRPVEKEALLEVCYRKEM